MTWYDILTTISKLTELDALSAENCARALGCKFEPTTENRYCSDTLQSPFEFAELISGTNKTKILLSLHVESPREEYAMRMLSLGKPIDIDVVSPPIGEETGAGSNLDWDRKYSLCFEIGDRPVWFGIEESNSRKKLVSVSLEQ